jgi:hypothetical protein
VVSVAGKRISISIVYTGRPNLAYVRFEGEKVYAALSTYSSIRDSIFHYTIAAAEPESTTEHHH